ncbi:MAG: glycerol-3-phosphate acyltransferase, partial [Roseomonas sp.]|nr:glycerol-3-phosphate acyltransferase [Roseomonas sp.]
MRGSVPASRRRIFASCRQNTSTAISKAISAWSVLDSTRAKSGAAAKAVSAAADDIFRSFAATSQSAQQASPTGQAAATLILDGLKGAVAVLLARHFLGDQDLVVGTAAVLGHLFPVWL